jgi:F-actin capping protein beta subunit
VRKLEVAVNEAFDVYRELYYEGGVGSVYLWDLDDGFAGVVLLKKGKFISYPFAFPPEGLAWNPKCLDFNSIC